MAITNNFFILIFALLPILFYIILLYGMIPENFVSLARARRYLISGLMSPFLIFLVYFIFPNWANPFFRDETLSYIFYAVFQIGLLEEFSKYSIFQWVSSERKSEKYDLPVATMFYSLMTAMGFALTENISYLISLYQTDSLNPLISQTELNNSMLYLALARSFTAVIMHMICGVMIGYFLAKYKNVNLDITRSNKFKKIRENKYFNISLGLFFASVYHGIYDVNLMLPNNNYKLLFTITIILFGLTIGYFMINELVKTSKIKRLCKLN